MTWPIDLIVALFVFVGRHPALPFAAMVIAPIAAAILLPTPSRKPFSGGARYSLLLLLVLVIANFFGGDRLANTLIFLAGEDGQAIVIATRKTNDTYNYHAVTAYDLTLRTSDGRVIQTTTRSDAFDIYPSGPRTVSDEGGTFKVRYLRHIPRIFIFVAN